MLSIFSSVMFASTTYNIENTTQGLLACTYSCTVTVSAYDRNHNYISLTPQTANIATTYNHNFTFTAPSGYYIDDATMTVTTTCGITFGPSTETKPKSCNSCTDYNQVTHWTNSSSLHWQIQADTL